MKKASENELNGILGYTKDPLVSSDIIGSTYSGIFDSGLTFVNENVVKVCSWYDNEYGYSCRVVDLAERMAG
jgi:glyceraldehyde 3-phosphate dehydrogenase